MKCNVKDSLRRQITAEISSVLDEQRLVWELLTLAVLHEQGFGEKRLERWGEAMQKKYNEFTIESSCTDILHKRGANKMTNIDTAVIRILRDLRRDNIDYLKILDIEDIKLDGESMEWVLDKMEEHS